ncbi:zinc-binding dehydrogenase [Nocardia sp. NPDC050718]|uniref:zinc-binding dehydrogenase n=1 Tax=Nocardia sp. NPDC050718 TaxID=3155788 RepID=UPI0033FD2A89
MRAIMAAEFGGPDVLELVEVDPPEPGPGQVVVEVAAIGVTWMDTRIRAGNGPTVFPVVPPFVPGSAVAGTVTALGADVAHHWLGTRLVTRAAGGYGGAYADAVLADADPNSAFPIPAALNSVAAVALIDDGATALALVERAVVAPGDHVLVAPGLGGLGHLASQLARSAGAHVIAAVAGQSKLTRARSLADDAVDYSQANWADQVRAITADRGLDVVFDGIGGSIGTAAAELLVDGGRFSGYGMASGSEAVLAQRDRQRLRVSDMRQLPEFWPESARRVREVLTSAASGLLGPIIGRTYPLAEAAVAHADIDARRFIGKLVLTP